MLVVVLEAIDLARSAILQALQALSFRLRDLAIGLGPAFSASNNGSALSDSSQFATIEFSGLASIVNSSALSALSAIVAISSLRTLRPRGGDQ